MGPAARALLRLALVALGVAGSAAPDPSVVSSLPDLDGSVAPDSMFSGYLTVDAQEDRNLFYIFVRSQADPENDPVIFWTNGGPGCSSVGEGFWMEHGAFRVRNAQAGVEANPYSWNRFASILYLEHPVGVGFSYAASPSQYRHLNDTMDAQDMYRALQAFVDRYPSFAPTPTRRPLYLSGESYGGEYVPHLAYKIMFGGESELLRSSLRGFVIGNPVFNCAAESSSVSSTLQYQMLFFHGLMSFAQYEKWAAAGCDRSPSLRCEGLLLEAFAAAGTANQQLHSQGRMLRAHTRKAAPAPPLVEADLDPDHKYQSFCLANNTLQFAVQPNADTQADQCNPLGEPGRMFTYLNRPDVQKALHVRAEKMPSPEWHACAGAWIRYQPSGLNVLTSYYEPIFRATTNSSFRVLIFSGDEDLATVPTPLTQACLAELPAVRTGNWSVWRYNGIAAGYFETFDRYTFATVKGAGHTVPQYQPVTSYALISRWFAGKNFST